MTAERTENREQRTEESARREERREKRRREEKKEKKRREREGGYWALGLELLCQAVNAVPVATGFGPTAVWLYALKYVSGGSEVTRRKNKAPPRETTTDERGKAKEDAGCSVTAVDGNSRKMTRVHGPIHGRHTAAYLSVSHFFCFYMAHGTVPSYRIVPSDGMCQMCVAARWHVSDVCRGRRA